MNYDMLPEHMRSAMRLYIEQHIPPGGFLTAVLSNKLVESFAKADQINQENMLNFVMFLYNEAPSECWGSEEKVDQWLNRGNTH